MAGDVFLAGSALLKFRILEVDTDEPPVDTHGLFVVEALAQPAQWSPYR